MDDLENVARLVVRAVSERLGDTRPEVLELVVREVVGAMSGATGVPPSSMTEENAAAHDNGDGTVTTGLGSVVPRPNEDQQTLEFCVNCVEQQRQSRSRRAVVTTTGQNTKGVVATMATQVAEVGGDIQDISQTIISEYFTMIMVVDIAALVVPFSAFKERILAAADKLGIQAVVMHEDVMRSLQRV